jgi:hypothetical protein
MLVTSSNNEDKKAEDTYRHAGSDLYVGPLLLSADMLTQYYVFTIVLPLLFPGPYHSSSYLHGPTTIRSSSSGV